MTSFRPNFAKKPLPEVEFVHIIVLRLERALVVFSQSWAARLIRSGNGPHIQEVCMLKKVFVIVFAVSALSLLLAGCKTDEAADAAAPATTAGADAPK